MVFQFQFQFQFQFKLQFLFVVCQCGWGRANLRAIGVFGKGERQEGGKVVGWLVVNHASRAKDKRSIPGGFHPNHFSLLK